MMNTNFARIAVVSFALVLNITIGVAQSQDISYSPKPIIYGQTITYTVPNTGNQISQVIWSWKMQGGCGASGTAKSTSTQYNAIETLPGTFEVYAAVTYAKNSGGTTPPPKTFQVTVTVPPPDGVKITLNNTLAPMGMSSVTQFQITCQGQPVGAIPGSAIPQECNYNYRYSNGFNFLGNSNQWAPTAFDPNFYISGNTIYDQRNIALTSNNANFNNSYSSQNPGSPWMSCTQKLRILLPDGCGGFTAWPLATGSTYLVKQANGEYSVYCTGYK